MGTTTAFPTLVGFRVVAVALAVMALIALVVGQADAGHLTGVPATYTLDADFDEGTLINVVHVPSDQLQLSNTTSAFNFIWVAVSTKGYCRQDQHPYRSRARRVFHQSRQRRRS